MKPRAHDPLRLDVEPFAREAGHLEGRWPLGSLARLASWLTEAASDRELRWTADGERTERTGADDEIWLRLRADAPLAMTCQRCLGAIEVPIAIDRRLRFARDEAAAEALDAELDDDVLALTRSLDLRSLIEDELMLALPIVPRHERCPDDAPATLAPSEPTDEVASPFAALAALKKTRDPRC